MKKKALLKLNTLLVLWCVGNASFGQIMEFNLEKASCQKYKSMFYVYGLSAGPKMTAMCIYKLNYQLKTLDSIIVNLDNTSPEGYLHTYSDTLHDYLNIYLQKKDKKQVTIIRLNKNFELVASIENVDVARLNSVSGFENDLFYFKNSVYTVKTQDDSSGKQFYLNKYSLKSDVKNFEYAPDWQFPFERKNINSVHIFYADHKQVAMYVTVHSGLKQGQWILRINAKNGSLIRGTKLNERGDQSVYEFGNFIADTIKKTFTFSGQLFNEKQWPENVKQPAIMNSPNVFIYLIQIDSLGDIIARDNFKAPIIDLKQGVKKNGGSYLLRISNMFKTNEDKLFLETDIFRSLDNLQTFLYSNTSFLIISPGDEQLVLEKCSIAVNTQIETYFATSDKLDLNGLLSNDSTGQFEKLYFKPLTLPVKLAFKLNAAGDALWLLKKSYSKKNTVNFTLLAPEKNKYQLTNLDDFPKSTEPQCTILTKDVFILYNQVSDKKLRLKLVGW